MFNCIHMLQVYQKKLGMLHHLPDNLLSGKQCRIDGTMDTQLTTTMK